MMPPLEATVLVIEDADSIAQLVQLYLAEAGARVLLAQDGVAGLRLFEHERPALVILDLMLPGLDGWTVARRIRETGSTPILMLTARRTEDDRVRGLDLGADDYVTKPFSPRELVSRVRAILRRASGPLTATAEDAGRLRFPGLVVAPAERRVEANGVPVELTAKEFDLLLTLAAAPGRVFDRQTLFSKVWGFDYLGDSRTVDVHVGTVRKKIEQDAAHPRYIKTVRGVGYRFDASASADEGYP
jgi:two-component system response regulator ResD